MTTFIEEQLTEAMYERVADVALDGNLVSRTVRRQRRRNTMKRTAYAGGVVALAGVLTAGVVAIDGTAPTTGHDRRAAAVGASPRLRLAAAVSTTRATSYRVKNTVVVRNPPGRPSWTVEGAFDPASVTGYLRMTFNDTGLYEERLVGGDLYHGDAPPGQPIAWQHDPGKHTSLSYDPKTNVLALSADPMQLLRGLTDSGATIHQTGPASYHFIAAIPPRKGLIGGRLAGDVTLDSRGRIAKVTYETTLHGTPTDNTVLDGTLDLSDYGAPVTVERPAGTFEDVPGK